MQKVEAAWADNHSLRSLRDLTFLHVAYSTLMRISEVARFRVGDVMRAEDGRIILKGYWTKTILDPGSMVKALGSKSSAVLTQWTVA